MVTAQSDIDYSQCINIATAMYLTSVARRLYREHYLWFHLVFVCISTWEWNIAGGEQKPEGEQMLNKVGQKVCYDLNKSLGSMKEGECVIWAPGGCMQHLDGILEAERFGVAFISWMLGIVVSQEVKHYRMHTFTPDFTTCFISFISSDKTRR